MVIPTVLSPIMLAKAISCIGLYDPDSLAISQHYKAGKVLGKGQYGTVRGYVFSNSDLERFFV